MIQPPLAFAPIPLKTVGPLKLIGPAVTDEVMVPLATYESPLWPSTQRGANLTRRCGGIQVTLVDECMTRSSIVQTQTAVQAQDYRQRILAQFETLAAIPLAYSRFTQLVDLTIQVIGNLLYLRFAFTTADAAGHNMVTLAADHIVAYLMQQYADLQYVAISGNYCTDKKVSAVNGILGRGKYVIAEVHITRTLCQRYLKTTPEQIVAINIKKNLVGSIAAGSVRSANADYANRLLGLYLATGQDAANIVEGSQGITYTEMQADTLYFSVTLPNIIVGTVGNGKSLDFVQHNLALLGCSDRCSTPNKAQRLAAIAGATVLCGELSLLAAQTQPGALMQSHLALERKTADGHP